MIQKFLFHIAPEEFVGVLDFLFLRLAERDRAFAVVAVDLLVNPIEAGLKTWADVDFLGQIRMNVERVMLLAKGLAEKGMNVLCQTKVAVGIDNDFCLRHALPFVLGGKSIQVGAGIHAADTKDRGDGSGAGLFLAYVAAQCVVGLGAEGVLHDPHEVIGSRCFAVKQLLADQIVVFVHVGNGGVQGGTGDFGEGFVMKRGKFLDFFVNGVQGNHVLFGPCEKHADLSLHAAGFFVIGEGVFGEGFGEKQGTGKGIGEIFGQIDFSLAQKVHGEDVA